MRVADGVVGQLRIPEYMHLTATPDAAIAVLVRSQILEVRLQHLAVRVGGILEADVRTAADSEGVVGVDVPIEHERVVVGMRNIALELAELRSARPDGLAGLCAVELSVRVLGQ